MRRIRRTSPSSRAGFSIWELAIGVTVLAVLARMVVGATAATSELTTTGNIKARIHSMSEKALAQIVTDLRMTGGQVVAGLEFPYTFDGGAPDDANYAAWRYQPAPQAAQAGDADFGVLRSIVLALPSDFDGNGRPEIDADSDGIPELDGDGDGVVTDEPADTNGIWNAAEATVDPDTRLSWSHEMISYVVTTGPTGQNELVRLVDGGDAGATVLATGVERVQFDTYQDSLEAGFGPIIDEDSIRVRIFFRVADDDGHVYHSRTEAVVGMRN